MRYLDSITDSMSRNLSKLQEMVKDRGAWSACSPRGHKESDRSQGLNNNNHRTNWLRQEYPWRPRLLCQRLLGNRMVKQPQSADSRQVSTYKGEKTKRNLADISCTVRLAGSQFPNKGLNPSHGSESLSPNHWTTREFQADTTLTKNKAYCHCKPLVRHTEKNTTSFKQYSCHKEIVLDSWL